MCNNAKVETLINDTRVLGNDPKNDRIRIMRSVQLYRFQSDQQNAPDVYVLEQRTYKEQGDWDRTISQKTEAFPVHYPSSRDRIEMLNEALAIIDSPFNGECPVNDEDEQ